MRATRAATTPAIAVPASGRRTRTLPLGTPTLRLATKHARPRGITQRMRPHAPQTAPAVHRERLARRTTRRCEPCRPRQWSRLPRAQTRRPTGLRPPRPSTPAARARSISPPFPLPHPPPEQARPHPPETFRARFRRVTCSVRSWPPATPATRCCRRARPAAPTTLPTDPSPGRPVCRPPIQRAHARPRLEQPIRRTEMGMTAPDVCTDDCRHRTA